MYNTPSYAALAGSVVGGHVLRRRSGMQAVAVVFGGLVSVDGEYGVDAIERGSGALDAYG